MYEIHNKKSGFTLIELLVVISIIAILSVVGLVIFQNAQKSAKDAKIKADLNAIKKAYETNYDPTLNGGQGGYKALSPDHDNKSTYFADGKIPVKPDGTQYTFEYGPDVSPYDKTDGYQISAIPSDEKPIYASSTQGSLASQGTLGTCDPGGTLNSGLVGYWKLDGNANDTTTNGYNGSLAGTPSWPNGQFNQAISLTGSQYVNLPNTGSGPFPTDNFTVTFWLKPSTTSGNSFFWMYGRSAGSGRVGLYREGTQWKAYAYWSVPMTFGGGSANTTQWTFVALLKKAGADVLFVNNDKFGPTNLSSNGAPPINAGGGAPIHYLGKGDWGLWLGLIDETRFYNRLLLDQEINTLYKNGSGCSP